MLKIGQRYFDQGAPAANPYVAPSSAQGADSSAQAGPTPSKKWAGKFENEQELEKGYENQQTYLTRLSEELKAERELRGQLENTLASVAERMSPADRVRQRSRAEEVLEAQGLPLDALDEYIEQRASRIADSRFDAKLAPLTQGAQTRQMIEEEFPGVDENDVRQFLRDNPSVNGKYQSKLQEGKVSEAMYFAYGQYAMAGGKPRDLSGLAEQQAQNRRDAALPGGRVGTPNDGTEEPSLADAWDKANHTGNIMDFLRPRLSHIIPTQR